MENKKIWLSSPHMGDNEFKYVTEAFDLNWIAPVGPHLNKPEYIGMLMHILVSVHIKLFSALSQLI